MQRTGRKSNAVSHLTYASGRVYETIVTGVAARTGCMRFVRVGDGNCESTERGISTKTTNSWPGSPKERLRYRAESTCRRFVRPRRMHRYDARRASVVISDRSSPSIELRDSSAKVLDCWSWQFGIFNMTIKLREIVNRMVKDDLNEVNAYYSACK